jgi:hypothetical protein
MFLGRTAHTGPAEALFHSLQEHLLLLRAEITLDLQKKTGHLLLQSVLDIINRCYLSRDLGVVRLRLVDEFIEPLALLV